MLSTSEAQRNGAEMSSRNAITALLGAGGLKPRIDGVRASGSPADTLLSLRSGNSVYSVALSPDGSRAVAGTRCGLLYVLRLNRESWDHRSDVLNQGAPVLSTCWVNDDIFAATDTSGRTLLWRLDGGSYVPQVLSEEAGPVCGLTVVGSRLVGHVAEGGVIEWDLDRPSRPNGTQCPGPPEPLASSKGVPWPANNAVVFPGKGGLLLHYDLDCRSVTAAVQAHQGSFHAIAASGDSLFTIGRYDETMKRWLPGRTEPDSVSRAPHDIVAVATLDDRDHRLIVVNASGQAQIVAVTGSGLHVHAVLPGSDYRTVAGPPPELMLQLSRRSAEDELGEIGHALDAMLDSGRYTGAEEYLDKLDRDSHHPMALAFRAQAAGIAGNYLNEHRYRSELSAILPDRQSSLDSLSRYAYVLELHWCLGDAATILRRIDAIRPGVAATAPRLDRVQDLASWLESGHGVLRLEEHTPVRALVEAADLASRPFHYRCLIKALDPISFDNIDLTAEGLIGKLHALQAKNRDRGLPSARTEELSLVSQYSVAHAVTAVTFDVGEHCETGIEFVVTFLARPTGTVVTPWVVFNARVVSPDTSIEGHNAACMQALDRVLSGSVSPSGIRAIHEACTIALGQIANEALAARSRRVHP